MIALSVYGVLRLEDLYHRQMLGQLFKPGYEMSLFWVEALLAVIIPLVLLTQRKIRTTAGGLYFVSVMVVLGFITNRLNVSLTGMETSAGLHYIPKWTEFAITAAMVAAGFFLFAMAVKYLPIFPEHKEPESTATATAPVLAKAAQVMSHAND
jgi:Ni/Fe-hydrogenase subunit HybB-like protein